MSDIPIHQVFVDAVKPSHPILLNRDQEYEIVRSTAMRTDGHGGERIEIIHYVRRVK